MEFAYLSINKGILIINSTLDACDLVLTYSFLFQMTLLSSTPLQEYLKRTWSPFSMATLSSAFLYLPWIKREKICFYPIESIGYYMYVCGILIGVHMITMRKQNLVREGSFFLSYRVWDMYFIFP